MSGDLLPPEPPPQLRPAAPSQSQSFTPPVIVVNTGSRPQPRLHSGGWFTRSFGAASGVLLAMFVFFTVVPLMVCGGLAYLGREGNRQEAKRASSSDVAITATARQMAMPTLKRQGIIEVSNESGAFTDDAGYTHYTGTGRTAAGKLLGFTVKFKVVTFGQKTTWKMESAIVDGRMVAGDDY
jgi:hypothetical protein